MSAEGEPEIDDGVLVAAALAAGVPTIAVPHVVPVPRLKGSVQIPTLAGVEPRDLMIMLTAAAR